MYLYIDWRSKRGNTCKKLLEIVGSENFSNDPKTLDKYSKDFSLAPRGAPNYVVKPKDTQEVQKVIKFANERFIPVVPSSNRTKVGRFI